MNNRVICFICFIMTCMVGQATHNRAGQILYRHISGDTYEFTLTTFTYTKSAADRYELEFSWGDNTSTMVPRVNGPVNPNGHFGELLWDNYKKNIYVGRHQFPGPGVYTITVEDRNRNDGVDNIPNSVGVVFCVKTIFRINPNTGHNNAPELLTYPIDKAAVGRRFVHNPSAYDIDGDSLSYELAVCLRERGIEIETYSFPESSNTPIYVNEVTGDFVWDAPVKKGFFNVAMKINEWRHGIKIGSIVRDMQIEVVDTDNLPPEFPVFRDTCVVAGEKITFSFKVTDPDNDLIELTATGGPFETATNKATLTIDDKKPGFTNATLTWQTDYSHVRRQPYTVVFKAEDQNTDVKLVSFANYNITVIAPEVAIQPAVAEKKEILLEWNPSVCDHASGYEIYRSIGKHELNLKPCVTGIPAGANYEKVVTLNGFNNTLYRDNNNGKGLSPGIEYCYRIVAIFSDGAKSLPSDETCAALLPGMPPMIRAHVKTVDAALGEIQVAWLEKPVKDMIANHPDPPQGTLAYKLFYTMDVNTGNWTSLAVKPLKDTTFIHASIDTKTRFPYYYKVELWDQDANVIVDEDYEIASSLYPILKPSDKAAIISFGRLTPWVNAEYDIYRCTKTGPDVCIATEFVGRTNRETYTDVGLRNGQEYCYRIESKGFRNIGGIEYKNTNWSHVACITPVDNVPPCAPVLKGKSICEENQNLLEWSYPSFPTESSCWYDVEKYRIYFSPDPARHPYTRIDSVMSRDIFEYSHNGTLVGCYYVTAVDTAGNQSAGSNIVCLDVCGEYDLPNVFTPNGDNINEVFKSYNPGGITKVDMRIYNRYGKLVFKTEDPDINWDGRDIDSKRFVATGVYIYTCEVYEERLTGSYTYPMTGFIHVFYGEGAQPYVPPEN